MTTNHVSGDSFAHGRTGARTLSPAEHSVFRLLSDHRIPESIDTLMAAENADGSVSRRVVALVTDLVALIDRNSVPLVEALDVAGHAVCARRPLSDCGYAWRRDERPELRVLVVGNDGDSHLCCSGDCADAVIDSGRAL